MKADYNTFLNAVESAYMSKFENLFVSKFSFEGDKNFDTMAQTLFFRSIFREGSAAVLAGVDQEKVIYRYYAAGNSGKYVGANGKIISAFLYPAWKNFSGQSLDATFGEAVKYGYVKKSQLIERNKKHNKVVFYQNFMGEDFLHGKSLKTMLKEFITELANKHLKAKLYNTIAGGKFVTSSEASIKNAMERSLFKSEEIINLDGDYNSVTGTFNIGEEIAENISVLPFNLDPNTFLDGIEKFETLTYKLFGYRTNQAFKKERMITSETEAYDQEFNGLDFNLLRSYQFFANDYNKTFGTNIILVDNLKSIEDKQTFNKEVEKDKQEVNYE